MPKPTGRRRTSFKSSTVGADTNARKDYAQPVPCFLRACKGGEIATVSRRASRGSDGLAQEAAKQYRRRTCLFPARWIGTRGEGFARVRSLGHGAFSVNKSDDDLLKVTFKNKRDLQIGLTAVMVQLAARHEVDPGSVKSLAVKNPENGEVLNASGAGLESGLEERIGKTKAL